MKRCVSFVFVMLVLLTCVVSPVSAGDSLMLATTTSTDNTGLLDVLAPMFKNDTGIELKWTPVGTGKALEIGRNCDVDVLLVHAPAAEKAYVAAGYGKDRTQLMYNDFVIIGPQEDLAGLKGMHVTDAFKKLADQEATFVSRGDNSGTNKKEIHLWKESGVGVPDEAPWYVQTGQGMMATLRVATEKGAYTMTDRGTFIKFADMHDGNPPLKIMVAGDSVLFNQYSILAVDADHCPDAKYKQTRIFIDWMTSEKVQTFIGNFKMLGQKLFIPNAN